MKGAFKRSTAFKIVVQTSTVLTRMASMLYYSVLFGWIMLVSLIQYTWTTSATKVTLTTPVNPVKEDAMLALHCHIQDLTDSQTVSIYRGVGEDFEQISWGDDILTSADERAYLARRILSDGSVVYFLSIMDIRREDQGSYTCEVLARVNQVLSRIAIGSVDVDVSYFPAEQYPLCNIKAPQVIYTGTRIALNCTSEEGSPDVKLTWKRTRTNEVVKSVQNNENGMSYSVLYLDITSYDEEGMFLCEMKSDIFPDKSGSCHVGPLQVIQNPAHAGPPDKEQNPDPGQKNDNAGAVTLQPDLYTQISRTEDKKQCQKMCAVKVSSNIQIWRTATIIAAVFAFVLFIIGIIIYMKICQETAKRKKRLSQTLPPSRQPMDCLYEELKYRQDNDGNKVYMALVRPRKPDSLAVPVSNMSHVLDPEGNYTLTPTTYNVAINNNN